MGSVATKYRALKVRQNLHVLLLCAAQAMTAQREKGSFRLLAIVIDKADLHLCVLHSLKQSFALSIIS